MREPAGTPEPTIGEAGRRIAAAAIDIVHAEAQLARREIGEIAPGAIRAGVIMAAGGIVFGYGFGFLLVAMFDGISHVLWPWLSALIVGELLVAGGGLAIAIAFMLLHTLRVPGTPHYRRRPPYGDWPRRRSQMGTTSVTPSPVRPSRYRE